MASLLQKLGFGARPSIATASSGDPPTVPRSHFPASDLSLRKGRHVGNSPDLERVLALPRRARPSEAELQALVEKWTAKLGKGNVRCECETRFRRRCCSRLLPVQAWALEEMSSVGGLLGPIGVGHGKSLLDLLSSTVIPATKTAVLLLPPNLKRQMLDVDWHFYGQHWHLPNLVGAGWYVPGKPLLHVVAFSELSGAKSSDLLPKLNPDLIIIDEAHNVRNSTAARTKRFMRFLKEHPYVRVLAWSGTLTSRSLKDYAHISAAALRQGSPVPLFHPTVEEWSAAVDPSPFPLDAGELRRLGEADARAGLRRRLLDTHGVVSSADDTRCEASLLINERQVECPEVIQEALKRVEQTWCRPDGEELVQALDIRRVQRELSSGFYYRWRWPRGESVEVIDRWLAVRKAWHSELRERLKSGGVHMDSPLLLTKAAIRWHDGYVHIERDEHGREIQRVEIKPRTRNGPQPTWESEHWLEWREVRETAQPETEAVWLHDFLVFDAVEWLRERSSGGICWYEHDAFARRVVGHAGSGADGVVFACPGADGDKRVLLLSGNERVVASIRAHGTGKNLQAFAHSLVAHPPADGATWEQLVGRMHRQGQLADEVTVEVYRHTPAYVEAVDRARGLAGYIQESFGAPQKLVARATWGFS